MTPRSQTSYSVRVENYSNDQIACALEAHAHDIPNSSLRTLIGEAVKRLFDDNPPATI